MILTYSFFHRKNFDNELLVAKQIADYAVANKHNKKLLSSKYVANFNLKSAIANQILRKYSGKTIKEAKNTCYPVWVSSDSEKILKKCKSNFFM